MSFILRKIRKARWYDHSSIPWLAPGEVQADALDDLKTEDNKLSVWYVNDDKSNLDDVLTAIAVNSDNPTSVDFTLVELAHLEQIGLGTINTNIGETPYQDANHWHRDLLELTAQMCLEIAVLIANPGKRHRYCRSDVIQLATEAVTAEKIKLSELSESWQKYIRKKMPDST